MSDNFQKTVNLRAREERRRRALQEGAVKRRRQIKNKETAKNKTASRAKEIDRVYNEKTETENVKKDLQKINRPEARHESEGIYKIISIVLAAVMVILVVYFFFLRSNEPNITVTDNTGSMWYSVKLINGESYYGQIEDTGSDPIVIKNVYYNYDQLNPESSGQDLEAGGNLRLVKRGKETQGGIGSMEFVRSNVLSWEELGKESKILKAILDYEK